MQTSARNRALVWTVITVAIVANIAGYLWQLYKRFWWFDDVLHAYSTFALTLPLALLLYGVVLCGAETRPILFILVVASLGVAVGVIWEVAEWAYDQVVPENAILGKKDTIIDLIMDTIGAVAAGVVSTRMVKA
jgi:VanZ family protein